MSLAGLKKQFNKANQFMTEKLGAAEGTKLDDAFADMERKVDVTIKLVDDLLLSTDEYLQPNPAIRAKQQAFNTVSKWRGLPKSSAPPQPETSLGDVMVKNGSDLPGSLFGEALQEFGESQRQLGEIKTCMEENVRQNFMEPLHNIQQKDLKEVTHHRKKLWGRRLDYDCKVRRIKGQGNTHATDAEIKMAEDKFGESKELAERAMHNLLENDVEQITQLMALLEGQLNYHRQATRVLEEAETALKRKREEAVARPKSEYKSTPITNLTNGNTLSVSPSKQSGVGVPSPRGSTQNHAAMPSARALYDFDAQNPGELSFKEGDLLALSSKVDENWYEGSVAVNDRPGTSKGFFPITYVSVIVPIP